MNETIYNLIPREYEEPPKVKMHKSSHDPKGTLTGSTFGNKYNINVFFLYFLRISLSLIMPACVTWLGGISGCHGSTRLPGAGVMKMKEGSFYGPPKGDLAESSRNMVQFKRAAAEAIAPKSLNWRESYKSTRPGLPDKNDRPVVGITTNKNFVTANAVEAILMGIFILSFLFFSVVM